MDIRLCICRLLLINLGCAHMVRSGSERRKEKNAYLMFYVINKRDMKTQATRQYIDVMRSCTKYKFLKFQASLYAVQSLRKETKKSNVSLLPQPQQSVRIKKKVVKGKAVQAIRPLYMQEKEKQYKPLGICTCSKGKAVRVVKRKEIK